MAELVIHFFLLLFPLIFLFQMVPALEAVTLIAFFYPFRYLFVLHEFVELLLEEIVHLQQLSVVVLELLDVLPDFADYVVQGLLLLRLVVEIFQQDQVVSYLFFLFTAELVKHQALRTDLLGKPERVQSQLVTFSKSRSCLWEELLILFLVNECFFGGVVFLAVVFEKTNSFSASVLFISGEGRYGVSILLEELGVGYSVEFASGAFGLALFGRQFSTVGEVTLLIGGLHWQLMPYPIKYNQEESVLLCHGNIVIVIVYQAEIKLQFTMEHKQIQIGWIRIFASQYQSQQHHMFRFFARNAYGFARTVKPNPSGFSGNFSSRLGLAAPGIAAIPLYMYFKNQVVCAQASEEQEEKGRVGSMATVDPRLIETPRTVWQKIRLVFSHIFRFFQLICIFLPPVLGFPLKMFKATEKIWLKLFVSAVERAGVVWIKAFQYLSHRRDVIGPEMAQALGHLRQNAPQHSFEQTKRNFKLAYDREIHEIFDEFDEVPIASGSVSQVYKAVYKGKKVAVKVRHPDVDKYIQRDVNIMFGISKFLALFSKAYEIPVGEESLKKTLIDQIDFNVEKDNLKIFNNHFYGNQSVRFPQAFEKETRDSILIESFVEGVPVTHFESNRHPLNPLIARLGASTFFEMLMKNNFIHADCHGGNILVEVTKQSATFFSEIKDYLKEKFRRLQEYLVENMMESQTLKALYKSSCEEEKRIREMIRKCTDNIKINVIDVGMVIKLNEHDRLNFTNFLKSIMEGNSQKCATLIYRLSNFNNKKLMEGTFEQYKQQLKKLFSVLDNTSIFDIEGISLLIGMLNIIRDHNMKLDGEFATLITNMVVLESIAKEIDPDIQILKCAIPYFKFVEDPNKPLQKEEQMSQVHL